MAFNVAFVSFCAVNVFLKKRGYSVYRDVQCADVLDKK